jgi:FkbM family methyltransferase
MWLAVIFYNALNVLNFQKEKSMNILNVLKLIYNHPFNSDNKVGGVLNFFRWQISCRLNPYPILYPYTENSKFIIWKGLTGATGNLYCGLMEYDDMAFLLHFLRPNDLFVDIGANVGAYTILASSEVNAKTIAVEPVPSTFRNLIDNISINQMQERVKALNIGLGSRNGKLHFTESLDTVNHVVTESDTESDTDTIEVNVSTLDSILLTEETPILLKIDVEGFETEVLNGAESTLANNKLKTIIIELNGSGRRYGYDEVKIHEKLIEFGFKPFSYSPKLKQLKERESFGTHNTIYLRDKEFVESRIETSRQIKIGRTQKYI